MTKLKSPEYLAITKVFRAFINDTPSRARTFDLLIKSAIMTHILCGFFGKGGHSGGHFFDIVHRLPFHENLIGIMLVVAVDHGRGVLDSKIF